MPDDSGFYDALERGDWRLAEKALELRPELARCNGGTGNCAPLLYVCFASGAGDPVETARVLLRYGADPNAARNHEGIPDNPLSCLYGAVGLLNNPALALVLLEAGANPNDGESLYHSTEHRDLECMRLLLRRGATPGGTNALKHMLDREDLAGLQLLLDAGADPNEVNHRGETALHWAVWRARSARVIAALLDAGADVNAKRHDGATAYSLALRSLQNEPAALLIQRGADTRLAPETPADRERLPADVAMTGRAAAVAELLAAGLPVNGRGEMGATALHWACWKGYADVVEILLNAGASLTIEDEAFHEAPPGWFRHGAANCGDGGGEYSAVERLLRAAGATIPEA